MESTLTQEDGSLLLKKPHQRKEAPLAQRVVSTQHPKFPNPVIEITYLFRKLPTPICKLGLLFPFPALTMIHQKNYKEQLGKFAILDHA
jgi:hypothetical protein